MLILETGSGMTDANSFSSVEEADVYFRDRFTDSGTLAMTAAENRDSDSVMHVLWIGTPDEKSGALVRATGHIEAVFGYRMKGPKKNPLQALCFPWEGMNEVPVNVRKATMEYALHALRGDLVPVSRTQTSETTKGNVIKLREKIGPIETETQYSPEGATITTRMSTPRSYPVADLLMRSFITDVSDDINPLNPVIMKSGSASFVRM